MTRVEKAIKLATLSYRNTKLVDSHNNKAPNPFYLSNKLFKELK